MILQGHISSAIARGGNHFSIGGQHGPSFRPHSLNVVVASGFSIAGLIKPELVLPAGATSTDASAIFAMYAAARTIPLVLVTMVAIYKGSASALLVLGLLAGIIQFVDAAVGLLQHDVGKTVGPLFLAILQVYAVTIFWKASKATSN